jgi:hypothetical protein
VSQSVSVITAANISAFSSAYEKILASAILFILSLYFIQNERDVKKIILILFIATTASFILQALIFFYPGIILSAGKYLLNNTYQELVDLNINRGRVYVGNYDEMLIPIVLYFLIERKEKVLFGFFAILISVFSFISNFRTRIVMLAFSILSFTLIFLKKIKKFLIFLIIIPIIFYFLYSFLYQETGYTVIDRLLLTNPGDYGAITNRVSRWEYSLEIGLSSPVFGVGLGNYYDYLSPAEQKVFTTSSEVENENALAAPYPHSIFFNTFAETGAFGFSALILLLVYFLEKDISVLRGENGLSKVFVISFWTLFIYGTVNPTDQIAFQSLFWLLRVLIMRSNYNINY